MVFTWPNMVNVLKFRTLFNFCFQRKCGLSGLELTKYKLEQQIGKTLQKQSDLGLHCLPRFFGLATSVQNFRTLTV